LTANRNSRYRRIKWKIHCVSPADKIFKLLNSNEGRKNFWAESAEEINGEIHFLFPNGETYISKIVMRIPNSEFSIIYFDTTVTFKLSKSKKPGTDLTLINNNVPAIEYEEIKAGWVSVLLALKAFADFGIDLRNHSKEKNWNTGFVDN
jgi:hypothetical protein